MTWGEVRNVRAFSILEDHYLDWWHSLEEFNMRGSYLHQSQWLGHHYGRTFQWAAGMPATGDGCYCVENIRVLIGSSLAVQWLGLCVSTAWIWFLVGELITGMPWYSKIIIINKSRVPELCCMSVCVLNCFSSVWLFANLWTAIFQAPLCMGFSR